MDIDNNQSLDNAGIQDVNIPQGLNTITQPQVQQTQAQDGVQPQAQDGMQTQIQPQVQDNTLNKDQLDLIASAFLDAQTQRENALRAEYQNAQTQVQKSEADLQIDFLKEKLGLSDIIKENETLKAEMEAMREQATMQKTKESIAELEAKYNDFSGQEIYNYLFELNKSNSVMAQALDNPQGWEMIYNQLKANHQTQATMQNTQSQVTMQNNQPDFMLSGIQGDSGFIPTDVMAKIKSGNATYSEMGSIFK